MRGNPVPTVDGCVPARTSTSNRSSLRFAVLSAAALGGSFVVLDRATAAAGTAESPPASRWRSAWLVSQGLSW